MKIYFNKHFLSSFSSVSFFILLTTLRVDLLNAQEQYLRDMQIDNSTKLEDDKQAIPTNPFEIVEMLRRSNSLNNATKPSDALDNALESFNIMEGNENP